MDEALREEAAEEAARDAVLEMEVDELVVEGAGVGEDDGARRSLAAPVPRLLVLLAAAAERVERRGPRGVGAGPLVESREAVRGAALDRRERERRGLPQLERGGEGFAEGVLFEAEGAAGGLHDAAEVVELDGEGLLALAGLLQLFGGKAFAVGERFRFEAAREGVGLGAADAPLEEGAEPLLEDG